MKTMSGKEAIRLLAQAVINIDEGMETIKKDSPIYDAMKDIVNTENAGAYLEHGSDMQACLEAEELGWLTSNVQWSRGEIHTLNYKVKGNI